MRAFIKLLDSSLTSSNSTCWDRISSHSFHRGQRGQKQAAAKHSVTCQEIRAWMRSFLQHIHFTVILCIEHVETFIKERNCAHFVIHPIFNSELHGTTQKPSKTRTHPYPLSLMSNSTKAGEEETLCGLKVRGDVMDTRLMIWWTGIAEPTEDSLRAVDCIKLKVRFSVFIGDPNEAPASELWPGLDNTTKIQCMTCFMSVFERPN